jgi:prevent-host-death family protein
MCYMRAGLRVGVRELRQNLSVYLDRVKRGETLTVTEHRTVVAVLAPPRVDADPIQRLVAAGLASPAARRPNEIPRPLRINLRTPLSELVRDGGDDTV